MHPTNSVDSKVSVKKRRLKPIGITLCLLYLIHLSVNLSIMRQFDKAYFSQGEMVIVNGSASTSKLTQQRPTIPRRLIFTYKYNLLNPQKEDPPFDAKDPFTANVLNTIDRYERYWKEADKANGRLPSPDNEAVVLSFLSNADCVQVINNTEPKLVKHFTKEKKGDLKADICRIAELLLYGGYYFDADISVVEPVNFDGLPIPDEEISDPATQIKQLRQGSDMMMPDQDDIVTFATVINVQGVFFQAFLAAMPNHPTIQRALDYILAYYEGNLEELIPDDTLPALARYSDTIPSRKNTHRIGLGTYTLAAAYLATPHNEWIEFTNKLWMDIGHAPAYNHSSTKKKMNYSRFLYEISLTSKDVTDAELFKDVPLQVNKKNKFGDRDWCNCVCFGGHKVYFFSRIVGSKGCPGGLKKKKE
ncbi:hypothetical protein ACHAXN_012550 [Cyclotella atomus]